MNPSRSPLIASLIVVLFTGGVSRADADSNSPPKDVAVSLLQLQAQLAEQAKRIDRLYSALGPQLAEMEERAAALKEMLEADSALAMKTVAHVTDENFTSKLMFLPGSRLLALAGRDHTIRLLTLPEGTVFATLSDAEGSIECLAVAADGKTIFAGTDKGLVFAWLEKEKTNTPVMVASTGDWPVTALAVSPDGTRVAWGCNGKHDTERKWIEPEESLVVLEAASGRKLWSSKIGRGDYQALSFSGDGKSLAVVQQGKVAVLDGATGRVLCELAHEQYPAGPLSTAMSRDGNLCAVGYGPNSIGLWDARAGQCLRTIKAHSNWVVSLAFSPDNSLLASSAGDTTASIWEVATGKEVGRFRFGDGAAYVYSVSISDDGRWLAAGRRGELVVLELPKK